MAWLKALGREVKVAGAAGAEREKLIMEIRDTLPVLVMTLVPTGTAAPQQALEHFTESSAGCKRQGGTGSLHGTHWFILIGRSHSCSQPFNVMWELVIWDCG